MTSNSLSFSFMPCEEKDIFPCALETEIRRWRQFTGKLRVIFRQYYTTGLDLLLTVNCTYLKILPCFASKGTFQYLLSLVVKSGGCLAAMVYCFSFYWIIKCHKEHMVYICFNAVKF